MSFKQMDLDYMGFMFMYPLIMLKNTQPEGSINNKTLGIIIYKMKQQGIMEPLNVIPENSDIEAIDKDGLLTLCANLQMHGADKRHAEHRRNEFNQIARLLRQYLYDNYKLSLNTPKRGKGEVFRRPTVQNGPKPS